MKHKLPIIMGFEPANKEVIVYPSRGKWSGFDVLIFHAKFKTSKKIGEPLRGVIDPSELESLACWLHFRTSESMEAFGSMLVDFAKKYKIGGEEDDTTNTD